MQERIFEEDYPIIDFDLIDFPSDGITLKHLRSLEPLLGEYTMGPDFDYAAHGHELLSMHDAECLFAHVGFASALGDPSTAESMRRQVVDSKEEAELRDNLVNLYVRYGVAEGLESAKQLVRRLEDQGAAQAKQLHGRTGGAGG